jgi:hypothetical protein
VLLAQCLLVNLPLKVSSDTLLNPDHGVRQLIKVESLGRLDLGEDLLVQNHIVLLIVCDEELLLLKRLFVLRVHGQVVVAHNRLEDR